jgi:hypothetical protein
MTEKLEDILPVQSAYRVWDRLQEIYWTNRNGRTVWGRVCDAKNSWNASCQCKEGRFNDQQRYVVRKFNLVFDSQLTHAAFGEKHERGTR